MGRKRGPWWWCGCFGLWEGGAQGLDRGLALTQGQQRLFACFSELHKRPRISTPGACSADWERRSGSFQCMAAGMYGRGCRKRMPGCSRRRCYGCILYEAEPKMPRDENHETVALTLRSILAGSWDLVLGFGQENTEGLASAAGSNRVASLRSPRMTPTVKPRGARPPKRVLLCSCRFPADWRVGDQVPIRWVVLFRDWGLAHPGQCHPRLSLRQAAKLAMRCDVMRSGIKSCTF